MNGFFSSGWIVVVLAFLTTGFSMVLNRMKKNEGPVIGIRALQAGLVVTTGLMLYQNLPRVPQGLPWG